jgi:putative N6-adenine-specific DNA methylase
MCGSGTLAIEAALIAAGRAPGLLRNNASCLHTALDIDDLYMAMRQEAKKSTPPNPAGTTKPIIATDFDPRAIEASRKNAMTAGVEHLIDFECCDFSETYVPDEPGHVIFNPEYGLRLGETDELKADYARIGDFFKNQCKGWTGHVFTGSRALSHEIGLKTSARHIFYNAQIECRLLSYELYQGTKKGSPNTNLNAEPS